MSSKIISSATVLVLAATASLGVVVGATAATDDVNLYLVHNGSAVTGYPERGVIVYEDPKPSLRGIVSPGDVLFRGVIDTKHKRVHGTAYVFKRGCAPAPYAVTGVEFHGESSFKLVGAAPVRAPHSCDVVGFSKTNGNASLQFDPLGDL